VSVSCVSLFERRGFDYAWLSPSPLKASAERKTDDHIVMTQLHYYPFD
jgi:hypothetical protein